MAWYDETVYSKAWNSSDAKKFFHENRKLFKDCGYSAAAWSLDQDFLDISLTPSPDCDCSSFEALEDHFGGSRKDGMFWTADETGKAIRFRLSN